MAEEQVIQQALVLKNEDEKILEKLRNMQISNSTAKQQDRLKIVKARFYRDFTQLIYSFIGLSRDQLMEFSTDGLKVLDKLVSRKARPWAICQMLFTFGVPFLGWIIGSMLFSDGNSWSYLHYRKYLIKVYGKEFLSNMTLRGEEAK